MKKGERFVVNVAPELDISSIDSLFQKLNVLFKASMVYSLRLDLHSAMKVMLDLARDLADFDKAIFYLLDEEDKSFYAELVCGFGEKVPPNLRKGNIFLDWTTENHLPIRVQESDGPEVEAAFAEISCRSVVSIPIIVESNARAVIQLFSSRPYNFTDDNIRFLWILVLQLEGLFHKMMRTEPGLGEGKDPFTDLPMRPQFDNEMEREFTRSRRNNRPFALMLISIDRFSELSHQAASFGGGMILREVVKRIIPMVRRIDTFTRYSETGLAILLPETELEQANVLANRIRSRVSGAPINIQSGLSQGSLTISIGLSGYPMAATVSDLLAEAEKNLEKAMENGGNRAVSRYSSNGHLEKKPISLDLQELLNTLGAVFDMDRLLRHLVDFFSRLTEADRVSILLLDETGNRLVFKHGIGFQGFEEDIQKSVIAVEDSICGQVLKKKEPLLVENIDLYMADRPKRGMRYSSPSFLSVPLIYQGKPIGVINFSNRIDRGSFTRDDLNLILPHVHTMARLLAEGKRFHVVQKDFLNDTADTLLNIAENKSPYLKGHSDRVSESTYRLARSLNIPDTEALRIANAARFHDLGRIAIDESILSKPGPLEAEEKNLMRQYPLWSNRLLQNFPNLEVDLAAVRTHHERYDGKGYPDGLMGEEIPIGGRILAVTDAYDSMIHERPFREAMSHEQAFATLEEESGAMFDKRVVKAFRETIQ
ncbi:MAG: GAF domain-containing protein [Proteobacteria bacterium]|nr:GAF domain-containing protein [Pseudomonadota bacterium]